jgi:hypothetical protein
LEHGDDRHVQLKDVTVIAQQISKRFVRIIVGFVIATGFASIQSYRAYANDGEWQCQASNGTYDVMQLPRIGQVREITGEMVFSKLDYGDRWKSNAGITFDDEVVDSECDCSGIKVVGYKNYPDILGVYLRHHGRLEELGSVPYDKPVTFKLSYSRDNKLKLEVGSGVVVAQHEFLSTSRVKLGCSGANVTFRNILAKADLGMETDLTRPRETIDR